MANFENDDGLKRTFFVYLILCYFKFKVIFFKDKINFVRIWNAWIVLYKSIFSILSYTKSLQISIYCTYFISSFFLSLLLFSSFLHLIFFCLLTSFKFKGKPNWCVFCFARGNDIEISICHTKQILLET